MTTKYYTVTLTEKQKHMILDALDAYFYNIEDDQRDVRVHKAAYEKIMNAKSGARKEKKE